MNKKKIPHQLIEIKYEAQQRSVKLMTMIAWCGVIYYRRNNYQGFAIFSCRAPTLVNYLIDPIAKISSNYYFPLRLTCPCSKLSINDRFVHELQFIVQLISKSFFQMNTWLWLWKNVEYDFKMNYYIYSTVHNGLYIYINQDREKPTKIPNSQGNDCLYRQGSILQMQWQRV